ncbi:glucose dehydrogenase [Xylogone sp. PMI_703]|nr:glucose dehydrogenase [Xylogone sp. PMI_703]
MSQGTDQAVPDQSFDYVIVGGGTAGCVLASRISAARPDASILLLEKGVKDDPRVLPALGFAPGFTSTIETNYRTVPQTNFAGITVSQTSGKLLGGSSAINYEVWTRGAAVDFKEWAEIAGSDRWSWDKLLPYFKATESFFPSKIQQEHVSQARIESIHGKDGPIKVSHSSNSGQPRKYPLRDDIESFHKALGAENILDINSGNIIGYSECASSNYDGQRQFAALGYTFGPNVTLWSETQAEKLEIAESKVTGVIVRKQASDEKSPGTSRIRVTANIEVILSAGALSSPKLLMLSGIGPADELAAHNIPLVHDLPVGKNLSDHPCVTSKWTITKPDASIGVGPMVTEECNWLAGPPMDWISFHQADDSILEKAFKELDNKFRTYFLSKEKAHWESFVMYGPFDTSERQIKIDPPEGKSVISVFNVLVSPLSRGTLKLRSSNPDDPPLIDPAFLKSPIDKEILHNAIRSTTIAVQSLKNLGAVEYTVDEGFQSDLSEAAINARIKQGGSSVFHFSGTCAMGSVVDSECRVKGVDNLRVVDASVFPTPLGAHYQASTYALAEQAAQLILGN